MKIGILTFHRALNYGAFLQAYATKCFLSSKGYDIDVVDYWPDEHDNYINRRKVTAPTLMGKIKQSLFYILCAPLSKKHRQKMAQMRCHYLGIPPKRTYRKGEELSKTNYDAVIYGSDQIWWNHTVYSKEIAYDPAYWGYYLPEKTKRIAYAPSMGIIDIREQDKDFICKSLKNFSSLSTRETQLREALLPYTNQPITTVLDPVFLPGKDFWDKQIVERSIQVPYLLYYSLIPSKESYEQAQLLAKGKGLQLVEVSARVKDFRQSPYLIQTADAIEFISLIYYADYVVSTSFHGTAFSIIFEKEFCVVGLGKKSGRVDSLLAQLGIEERYTTAPSSLGKIDYLAVKKRLNVLQKESRDYLLNALNK